VRSALRQVEVAAGQLIEAGTPDQKQRAERLLVELRRQLYLLLAEDPTGGGSAPVDGGPAEGGPAGGSPA
jgi:hypothetical protein